MAKSVDLISLFQAVTETLQQNRASLNQADEYNHDHGDNMVEIFRVITEAMEAKRDASPADQLAYASELLRARSKSGSADLYAQGLSRAAQEFQGKKKVTTEAVPTLIQALLGAQTPTARATPTTGGDLLGTLLSGLSGGQARERDQSLDLGDLLNAGMAFMSAKQQGGDNLEALISAIGATTQAGERPYRAQSGALVANTLLELIAGMSKR